VGVKKKKCDLLLGVAVYMFVLARSKENWKKTQNYERKLTEGGSAFTSLEGGKMQPDPIVC